MALSKKGQSFTWSDACRAAFEKLKLAFTTSPVLAHFDPEKPIVLETDASDFVSAGVLSQYSADGTSMWLFSVRSILRQNAITRFTIRNFLQLYDVLRSGDRSWKEAHFRYK